MASPFSIFRKNQKVMLAVVGIMAMIAFVFVPTWGGGDSMPRGENPKVVTWKYGTLYENDIVQMQQWNRVINQFLATAIAQATGNPQFVPMVFQEIRTDEEFVVNMMLMAKKAEKLGLEASDVAVNAFIGQQTRQLATREHLSAAARNLRIGDGRPVSEGQLFDAFRPLVLMNNLQNLLARGTMTDTPAARWDQYNKLNRTVTAQAVPVAVADFVAQVPDPSEEELVAFFEANREQVSGPVLVQGLRLQSPDVGFRMPYKAKFQYFVANRLRVGEQILAENQFTDAELREHYEKTRWRYLVPAATTPSTGTEAPAGEGTTEPPSSEVPSTEGTASPDAAPATEETVVPAAETPAAGEGGAAPAAEETSTDAAPEAPATETPAAETPAESAPQAGGDEGGAETPPAADTGDQSSSDRDQYLLALADEVLLAQADESAAPPAENAPAAEQATEPAADAVAPEAAAPAGEATAGESAVAGETTTTTPGQNVNNPFAGLGDLPGGVQEYRPFEEVVEEVKRDLASTRAEERIQKAFDEIRSQVASYNDRLIRWNLDRENEPNAPAPKQPDFTEFEKKHGLTFVAETPLMSAAEAADHPQFPSDELFMRQIFSDTVSRYQPVRTSDVTDNQFLVWKTEDQASKVPTLDEVRDQVVQAWKMVQARDLAMKAAASQAAKTRQAGATLQSEYGEKAVEVGPFTAATLGSVPNMNMMMPQEQQVRLTELPQLDNAGPDFMDTVSSLQVNEVGTAWNHPKTIAYVVQVTAVGEDLEIARRKFVASVATDANQLAQLGMPLRQTAFQNWMEQLQAEADLRWLRPPRVEQF